MTLSSVQHLKRMCSSLIKYGLLLNYSQYAIAASDVPRLLPDPRRLYYLLFVLLCIIENGILDIFLNKFEARLVMAWLLNVVSQLHVLLEEIVSIN